MSHDFKSKEERIGSEKISVPLRGNKLDSTWKGIYKLSWACAGKLHLGHDWFGSNHNNLSRA